MSTVCHPQGVAGIRALTTDKLGAWLFKATGSEPSTQAHVRAGFADVESWCVRPTYRTDLVVAGQRVLLWVSGTAAGIYAYGRTTGPARDGVVPVALTALAPPLLRSELTGHADLARLEVIRMPAGSNPSYVTRAQLEVLAGMREELARPV
jgi:hypothetical protein